LRNWELFTLFPTDKFKKNTYYFYSSRFAQVELSKIYCFTLFLGGIINMTTITGDDNSNQLRGTESNNTIWGNGGSDTMYGFGGNDHFGDVGKFSHWDIIDGGSGNDRIEGWVHYVPHRRFWGWEHIYYSAFQGSAQGGAGDDQIINVQNVWGGDGNDLIEKTRLHVPNAVRTEGAWYRPDNQGGVPYFYFNGGNGHDIIRILKEGSWDVRKGTLQNDFDTIWAGNGNDEIVHTQETNADINGANGNDVLKIALSRDNYKIAYGGPDADLFILDDAGESPQDRNLSTAGTLNIFSAIAGFFPFGGQAISAALSIAGTLSSELQGTSAQAPTILGTSPGIHIPDFEPGDVVLTKMNLGIANDRTPRFKNNIHNSNNGGVALINRGGEDVVYIKLPSSKFRLRSDIVKHNNEDYYRYYAFDSSSIFYLQRWATWQGAYWDSQDWLVGNFDGTGGVDLAKNFIEAGRNNIDIHISDMNTLSFNMTRGITRAGSQMPGEKFVSGDFNRDGRDDVAKIFSWGGQDNIDVYSSNGSSFSMERWATAMGGTINPQQFLAGDFNGDGRDDITKIFSHGGLDSIDVYRSNGRGFTMERWATNMGGTINPQQFLAGDFNGDGRDDILKTFSHAGLDHFDVYQSNGRGFTMNRWATGMGATMPNQKFVAGDFNGDGRDDIAKVFGINGTAYVDIMASGGNSFRHFGSRDIGGGIGGGGFWGSQKWFAGDFNGDGRDDLGKVFGDGGWASIDIHVNLHTENINVV